MHPRSTRRRAVALAAPVALALAVTGGALAGTAATAAPGGGHGKNATADSAGTAGVDTSSAVVQLSMAPLTTSERTKPGNGQKIDFKSATVKNERARLAQQRNDFKQWLRANAPTAKVTGEYDVAVNAVAVRLGGTSLDTLRSAPGVVSASYQAGYVPLAKPSGKGAQAPAATAADGDPDLARIDAEAAWGASQGEDVLVGVVDSGIDAAHPCFDDTGYAAHTQLGDTSLTNNKVIVAKVFNNKAQQLGLDASAVGEHGTHVAGTIACNEDTDAMVGDVPVSGTDDGYTPSGVAPRALLGNYNVFPGDVENARSEDILNALDEAVEDGVDVINMSLGGGAAGVQDLLTVAVDNIDASGQAVVAVAAGNDGPGHYTVGSPGSAQRALTAGASSVGHFISLPLTGVDLAGGTVPTAVGDFPVPASDAGSLVPVTGADKSLSTGCSLEAATWPTTTADVGTDGYTIAVVSRGVCSFSDKATTARAHGADALVVVNNVAGDPTAMGLTEGPAYDNSLPAVMAGLDQKAALMTADSTVSFATERDYVRTGNDDIMAGFSSQGPTDVDYRVKPDVVAPGVNVLSSVPTDVDPGEGDWAFMQGTSMATPHLAGMAAVVIGAHPDWTPEQVRSAIVNTAVDGTLTRYTDGTTVEKDVNVVGAGLANLPAAVGADLAVSPVSTSFGAVPANSSKPLTRTITLTSLSGATGAEATLAEGHNPAFSVQETTWSGDTATVTVTFDARKATARGDQSAVLQIGDVAHTVLYAFVK